MSAMRPGPGMTSIRVGSGSTDGHVRNTRRAMIVRAHRRRQLRELREIEMVATVTKVKP